MRSLSTFTPRTEKEEAAMALSKQLCFEGNQLFDQGNYADALEAFRQDMELCGELCGKDHSYFANSLWDMATCYMRLDEPGFAETLFRRAQEIHEQACGPKHELTLRDLIGRSVSLLRQGEFERALTLRLQHLAILDEAPDPDKAWTVYACRFIAQAHGELGQHAEATPYLHRCLTIEEKLCGKDSEQAIEAVELLARNYEQRQQYEHAVPLRQRTLAYHESLAGEQGNRAVVVALQELACCIGQFGKRDTALSMLWRAAEMNRMLYEREVCRHASHFAELGAAYELLEDTDNARKLHEWHHRMRCDVIGTEVEELHKGARYGNLDRAKIALENGAPADARDEHGRSALHDGARNGHREIVELLLKEGADLNGADLFGRTPLREALASGDRGLFESLLQRGADANTVDKSGRTLLMECCVNHPEYFARALELTPDLELVDEEGKTALMLAAEWGSDEAVSMLLARGVQVDTKDKSGCTALMYAARGKAVVAEGVFPGIARMLLDAGADPTRRAQDGKTALDHALEGDELQGIAFAQEGMAELIRGGILQWMARQRAMLTASSQGEDGHAAEGLMTPPWVRFPGLVSMYDVVEGSDEYIREFWTWLKTDGEEKQAELLLNPDSDSPSGWRNFYWHMLGTERMETYADALFGQARGESRTDAVTIRTNDVLLYVLGEYAFIERCCGRVGKSWKLRQHGQVAEAGRICDQMEVELKDGTLRQFHFTRRMPPWESA